MHVVCRQRRCRFVSPFALLLVISLLVFLPRAVRGSGVAYKRTQLRAALVYTEEVLTKVGTREVYFS